MQGYGREEKRLLEDVQYGMFLGTEEFIDKIRSTYLPCRVHQEIPQKRKVARGIDPVQFIDTAARLLDGDLDGFRQTDRISKSEKPNRDLLVLFMWSTGPMTNEEIGALFGLTYSSVSHIVNLIKSRLTHEPEQSSPYLKKWLR